MNKYYQHFKTITKHKFLVMKFCFKCGFYKRGLLHDLSKYTPIEFLTSAKYWTGNRSPIDNEKDEKGYSLAWFHHKGHNPHHWEYWIDNVGTKENKPAKIPFEYLIEMICDWLSASIVYSKVKIDYNEPFHIPYVHYVQHKNVRIFHPDTEKALEYYMTMINEYGINRFCETVKSSRKEVKKNEKEKTRKGEN